MAYFISSNIILILFFNFNSQLLTVKSAARMDERFINSLMHAH